MDVDVLPLRFPLPFNPCSPPNWRWQLAESIAKPRPGRKPRWLKEYSDRYVLMAVQHLQGTAPESTDREAADQARRLHRASGPRRWRLEARLLAGLSVEEVAAAEQLPPQVIEAFTALFFDVRDGLGATDYILLQAIANRPDSLTPRGRGQKVKRLGYQCGPFILSALLLELGSDTPWDRAVVGPDPSLGPHLRALLLVQDLPDLPGEELFLIAKLLDDKALFSNSERPVPAWILTGLRHLETDGKAPECGISESHGKTDRSGAVPGSKRRAIA
jgi:hypothetical protein